MVCGSLLSLFNGILVKGILANLVKILCKKMYHSYHDCDLLRICVERVSSNPCGFIQMQLGVLRMLYNIIVCKFLTMGLLLLKCKNYLNYFYGNVPVIWR